MATLTVRDLADEVCDELRSLAARNGRSMEAEVRVALTSYVREQRGPTLLKAAERFRAQTGGVDLELPGRRGAAETPTL